METGLRCGWYHRKWLQKTAFIVGLKEEDIPPVSQIDTALATVLSRHASGRLRSVLQQMNSSVTTCCRLSADEGVVNAGALRAAREPPGERLTTVSAVSSV